MCVAHWSGRRPSWRHTDVCRHGRDRSEIFLRPLRDLQMIRMYSCIQCKNECSPATCAHLTVERCPFLFIYLCATDCARWVSLVYLYGTFGPALVPLLYASLLFYGPIKLWPGLSVKSYGSSLLRETAVQRTAPRGPASAFRAVRQTVRQRCASAHMRCVYTPRAVPKRAPYLSSRHDSRLRGEREKSGVRTPRRAHGATGAARSRSRSFALEHALHWSLTRLEASWT